MTKEKCKYLKIEKKGYLNKKKKTRTHFVTSNNLINIQKIHFSCYLE